VGHNSFGDWWDELIDVAADRLIDYYQTTLGEIEQLQQQFQTTLSQSEVGSAEHTEATQALGVLSRAEIRLRGQMSTARELYERGLGPLSGEP
jgi:hypothetical protein